MLLEFSWAPRGRHTPEPLGSAEFPVGLKANLTYVCRDCGRNWAWVRGDGLRTWFIAPRSCGCHPHDAMSLFEPGLLQLTPYGAASLPEMEWMVAFPLWPEEVLRHEFLQLLDNLEQSVFYDSPNRDNHG